MNILALDTSNEYCSIALLTGDGMHERDAFAGQGHSGVVLPMIEQILAECRLDLRKIDAIAFGSGPGSFTGPRIACGVAQGLALGLGIPVFGISTLEAMAHAVEGERILCCLDARMGEVYHAAYSKEGGAFEMQSEPALHLPEEAPEPEGSDWIGCGTGFALPALRERYAGKLSVILPDIRPKAASIAQIALEAFRSGKGMDAALAAPLYVRNKVALKESER